MFDISAFARNERFKQGMEQQEVADKAGIHVNTYRRVEGNEGNVSLYVVNAILEAFGYEIQIVKAGAGDI